MNAARSSYARLEPALQSKLHNLMRWEMQTEAVLTALVANAGDGINPLWLDFELFAQRDAMDAPSRMLQKLLRVR